MTTSTPLRSSATPLYKLPAPRVFLLALWFGLVTGLGEVFLLGIARFFLHRIIHLGPDVVWMAPVADVSIFVVTASAFVLLSRWYPRFVTFPLVVFAFSLLGLLSLLLMYQRLHPYAAALLAAGLAATVIRSIGHRVNSFTSFVFYSSRGLVLVVVLLAVGLRGWPWLVATTSHPALPPAPPGVPNVLLVILDTVRAHNLSVYGYTRPTTPTLERLASRGVLFERAISPSPWTLPSHASMFTGRFAHELSADWETPLDGAYPTLAEVLRAHGYLTVGFVGNTDVCSYEFGLNRGFDHYEDYVVSVGAILRSSSLARIITNSLWLRRVIGNYQTLGRKTGAEVTDGFLRWVSHRDQRPFFAFLNYFDAHAPYLPPPPFDERFGSRRPRSNPWLLPEWSWSPEDIQAEIDAYDGSIAYLDHGIRSLLDGLQKLDVLERTVVIVTADHGEEFGEHGLFSHGHSLYMRSLHVPLLISFPSQVPAGKRVSELVTLRDLPATVLDLVGLATDSRLPGTSLVRYWNSERDPESPAPRVMLAEVNFARNLPKWFPVSKGNMKALVGRHRHYIRNGDGTEELYDIDTDREERHDLARTEDGRRAIEQFRQSLKAMVADRQDQPDGTGSSGHHVGRDARQLCARRVGVEMTIARNGSADPACRLTRHEQSGMIGFEPPVTP